MSVFSIKNLCFSYFTDKGETKALSDINLTVEKGQFISIVGPSGCGKSTLLSLMSGLIAPTFGSILINGKSVEEGKGEIGYMLQKDHLFEWRTVYGNVCLGFDIHKKKDTRHMAEHYLSQYGLSDFKNAKPSELSGGMRQRVALIRTLMMEPDILLLDEPFSALDYQTRLSVCDDISSIIKKEKKTAILVTHDLAEAISVGEVVYVLTSRPGKIKSVIPLTFPKQMTSLERRHTPEFNTYYNILWKEFMPDEATK